MTMSKLAVNVLQLNEVADFTSKHDLKNEFMNTEKTSLENESQPSCLGAVSISLPPDVAEKILKARDAFVEKDYDVVWHWLYSIASPNCDKIEPWEDLERMAGRL